MTRSICCSVVEIPQDIHLIGYSGHFVLKNSVFRDKNNTNRLLQYENDTIETIEPIKSKPAFI